jgi:quinol-cytochrome oxidoreductase complex cytochrome b subunit
MSERSFWDWITDTLHLRDLPFMAAPSLMFNVRYWFGTIAVAALAWQVLTGLILLLYYQPSNAYDSTMAIIHNVPFGSILLSSHLYGAYVMILAAYVHGIDVFLRGTYKKSGGAQWVLGVLLFVLTLGVSFIGYSLTGDVLATDAVDVGKGVLTALGLQSLIPVFFGNGTQLDLFTRLLGWHIIVAAVIILLFMLHYPRVGYRVPAISRNNDLTIKPWWPRNLIFTLAVTLLTWGVILLVPSILAVPQVLGKVPILFSPYPGPSLTSPQASSIPAYPPWFFLFLYKMVDMPFGLTVNAVMGIVIPLVVLLIIPALDRGGSPHLLDRPWVTALFITGLIWVIELSVWGAVQPGIPVKPTWFAVVIIPPVLVSFGGVYAARRRWIKVKGRIARFTTRGVKFNLSKNTAVALGYSTSMIAIVAITTSFALNPISDGPYVGVMWGIALISLAASLMAYLYVEYL